MADYVLINKQELRELIAEMVTKEVTIMNSKEAAEFLGISTYTLRDKVKNGLIECSRMPGSTRMLFLKENLQKALNA